MRVARLELLALSVLFSTSGSGWRQVAKLVPANGEPNEWVGYPHVALGDDVALLGAMLDGESGSVVVFEHFGVGWAETATLLPEDVTRDVGFGSAVAVTNEGALVGAQSDSERAFLAGAAYDFRRAPDGSWPSYGGPGHRPMKLTASDAGAVDLFGHDIAVSGRTAVISAPYHASIGAVYVFESWPDGWLESAKLVPGDGKPGDAFGWSVALSGGTAVIGAVGHDSTAKNGGAAYVFDRDDSGWHLTTKLEPPPGQPELGLGGSVAIQGSTMLATGPGGGFGSAYVFERRGSAWLQTAHLAPATLSYGFAFGVSAALDDQLILVGAHKPQLPVPGEVFVFERSDTSWRETAVLAADDGWEYNGFGWSVALSGRTALISAPWDDDNGISSGSAYVFELGARAR